MHRIEKQSSFKFVYEDQLIKNLTAQNIAVSRNFLENLEGKLAGLVYNPQPDELSIRGVSTFDAVRKSVCHPVRS